MAETLLGGWFFRIEQVANALGGARLIRLQQPNAHPQQVKNRSHPAGVAACQVIVDGHQVGAFALQGVQVQRQGRHQGLAFAGAHLGNCAARQDNPADDLHIVRAQADRAPGGFPHRGKCLRQELVQAGPFLQALSELLRAQAQVGIGQLVILSLQRVDPGEDGRILGYLAAVGIAVEN